MAIANDNIFLNSVHGKIGDMICRKVGDLTIVSRAPDYSKIKWSKAQKAARKRFSAAVKYANKALENKEVRDYYEKKRKVKQTKNNVAIADYMVNPRIERINADQYKGRKGDTIRIDTWSNFGVASVIVVILNALGYEVERGMAIEMPFSATSEWIYKSKEENSYWQGGHIEVRAASLPGNEAKAFIQFGYT